MERSGTGKPNGLESRRAAGHRRSGGSTPLRSSDSEDERGGSLGLAGNQRARQCGLRLLHPPQKREPNALGYRELRTAEHDDFARALIGPVDQWLSRHPLKVKNRDRNPAGSLLPLLSASSIRPGRLPFKQQSWVQIPVRTLRPRSLMDRAPGYEPGTVGVRVSPGAPCVRNEAGSPERGLALIRPDDRIDTDARYQREGLTVSRLSGGQEAVGSTPATLTAGA